MTVLVSSRKVGNFYSMHLPRYVIVDDEVQQEALRIDSWRDEQRVWAIRGEQVGVHSMLNQ